MLNVFTTGGTVYVYTTELKYCDLQPSLLDNGKHIEIAIVYQVLPPKDTLTQAIIFDKILITINSVCVML